MALLKLGGVITGISGKVGGSVLGTGPSGSYMKSNSYSQQKNSSLQSLQRTKIGLASQFWRDLTNSQKTLWQNETPNYPFVNRVGDEAFYTAFQLFNKINLNRLQVGLPVAENPPVYTAPSDIVFTPLGIDATNIFLQYSNVLATDTIIIYSSPPMQQGTSNMPSKLRQIIVYDNAVTNDLYSFYAAWSAIYGAISSDTAIWVTVKIVNRTTGIPSAKLEAKKVAFGF